MVLVMVASLLLGVAAVGPAWGVETVPAGAPAGDVALVLDASGSMLVEDVAPNRLDAPEARSRASCWRTCGARGWRW
jgi:hypothetical protein